MEVSRGTVIIREVLLTYCHHDEVFFIGHAGVGECYLELVTSGGSLLFVSGEARRRVFDGAEPAADCWVQRVVAFAASFGAGSCWT
jgi:hypothetical protein